MWQPTSLHHKLSGFRIYAKSCLGVPVLMVQTSVRYGEDSAAFHLHAQHLSGDQKVCDAEGLCPSRMTG